MLQFYFLDSVTQDKLRCGLLREHMDELAAVLRARGYRRDGARAALRCARDLSEFADETGKRRAKLIDEQLIQQFRHEKERRLGPSPQLRAQINLVVKLLTACKLFAVAPPRVDAAGHLLERYEHHLLDVRGLATTSVQKFVRGAELFVAWSDAQKRPVRRTRGRDVLDFVMHHTEARTGSFGSELCSQLRIFLRFLHGEGLIKAELDRVVPKVPRWRLAALPRHLPWRQVQKLIASVDTTHGVGLRDRAILLLIAALGLRNVEVRNLRLSEISWRTGELRLVRTKTRRERVLPLPGRVGSAITAYLLRGRPEFNSPFVFLRNCAPLGPFSSPNGIGNMVRRRLRDADINAPSRPGSHLLRHSLATKMVNTGVPVKEIADLLGHASINTTAIYAKVDRKRIANVALPFPEPRV